MGPRVRIEPAVTQRCTACVVIPLYIYLNGRLIYVCFHNLSIGHSISIGNVGFLKQTKERCVFSFCALGKFSLEDSLCLTHRGPARPAHILISSGCITRGGGRHRGVKTKTKKVLSLRDGLISESVHPPDDTSSGERERASRGHIFKSCRVSACRRGDEQ